MAAITPISDLLDDGASMLAFNSIGLTAAFGMTVPVVTAVAGSAANGVDVTFDQPVAAGSTPTPPTAAGWTLPATPVAQQAAQTIRVAVVDVPPTLQTIGDVDDTGWPGLGLIFDLPVNIGTPFIGNTAPGKGWTFTGAVNHGFGFALWVDVADVPPTILGLDGSSGELIVTTDLPVVAGTPTIVQPPGAAGWTIDGSGQVTLTSVQVSLTVTSGNNPNIVSIVAADHKVTITFDRTVNLTVFGFDSRNWRVNPTSGAAGVTVNSVSSDGLDVVLTTTEMTNSGAYSLSAPAGVVSNGGFVNNTLSAAFIGYGVKPNILFAQATSARTLLVTFDEDVNIDDALTLSNYTVTGGVTVQEAHARTARVIALTVSPMQPAVTYTVTASNIRDLAGNVV